MGNIDIVDLGYNGYKIKQDKRYFCFGMDSVLLANFVSSNNANNVILDLCTGSGVIPVIISYKKKYKKIYGVELQKEMFELFKENVNLNKLNDKIECINEDIKNIKNIRKKLIDNENKDVFDIICVNPPYKKGGTGIKNDDTVKYIARHEVMCTLEDVFFTSKSLLKSNGKMYMVHKPDRLVDIIYFARKYKLEPKKIQFVYPKVDKKPSIVLLEFVKNGRGQLDVLEPLIEYNEDGSYTDSIYKVYGMENKDVKKEC